MDGLVLPVRVLSSVRLFIRSEVGHDLRLRGDLLKVRVGGKVAHLVILAAQRLDGIFELLIFEVVGLVAVDVIEEEGKGAVVGDRNREPHLGICHDYARDKRRVHLTGKNTDNLKEASGLYARLMNLFIGSLKETREL